MLRQPSRTPPLKNSIACHTFLDLCAPPLPDAGPAGIGQHSAAHLLKDVQQAVTSDGGPDLLTAGGDGEGHLDAHKDQSPMESGKVEISKG